jgi:hypothetical protein
MPAFALYRRKPGEINFHSAGPEAAQTAQEAADRRVRKFPHFSPVGTEVLVTRHGDAPKLFKVAAVRTEVVKVVTEIGVVPTGCPCVGTPDPHEHTGTERRDDRS